PDRPTRWREGEEAAEARLDRERELLQRPGLPGEHEGPERLAHEEHLRPPKDVEVRETALPDERGRLPLVRLACARHAQQSGVRRASRHELVRLRALGVLFEGETKRWWRGVRDDPAHAWAGRGVWRV